MDIATSLCLTVSYFDVGSQSTTITPALAPYHPFSLRQSASETNRESAGSVIRTAVNLSPPAIYLICEKQNPVIVCSAPVLASSQAEVLQRWFCNCNILVGPPIGCFLRHGAHIRQKIPHSFILQGLCFRLHQHRFRSIITPSHPFPALDGAWTPTLPVSRFCVTGSSIFVWWIVLLRKRQPCGSAESDHLLIPGIERTGASAMIGKTLAHYEITTQLGKGGMGEVYRAKDLTLGRDVAIKILPEEFAKDADRVARFQREAKLLASLNHPSIAAIYGLDECDGIKFLVLELVEGCTLADQIKAGPVPVEEALKLALQIAEALETAHRSCGLNMTCRRGSKQLVLPFPPMESNSSTAQLKGFTCVLWKNLRLSLFPEPRK
jgi:hypothetical protein